MGSVIGEILPFALGIAISPIPIIAAILMLLSPKAKVGFGRTMTAARSDAGDRDQAMAGQTARHAETRFAEMDAGDRQNALIMAILLLVISVSLIGKGIGSF